MTVTPIAFVKNDQPETVDFGWAGVTSTIRLEPGYAAGLRGLEAYSHALIIFWMHQAQFDANQHLERHPRENPDLPLMGIFAQRARHRPNPIGVTAVEILGVNGPELRVKGLDAIDGTPIIDIKPYVPAFDRVESTRTPDWLSGIMTDYFEMK